MKKTGNLLKYSEIILIIILQFYITSTVLMQSISPVFEIIFWGSISFTFLLYLIKSVKEQNEFSILQKLFITYYIYIIISCLRLNNFVLSLHGLYEYILYTISFFVSIYIYKKMKIRNLEIYASILVSIETLLGTLGFIELSTKSLILGGNAHFFDTSTASYIRSQVFSGSPLIYGIVMGCGVIFTLAFYFKVRHPILLLCTILIFAGMLASGSRGPLIATLIGLAIYFAVKYIAESYNSIALKSYIKIALGILGLLLLLFFIGKDYDGNNPILMKVFSVFNWETDIGNIGRLETWSRYLQIFEENWLFGTGVSTTGSVTLGIPGNIGVTESSILKILVELGVLGFIAYYSIIIYVLYIGIKNVKNIPKSDKELMALCISIIFALLVEGAVLQVTEIFNVSVILWFCLGLIYSSSIHGQIQPNNIE